MNLMLVTKSGKLLTPELSDSILDGVTRRSLLELAPQLGLEPEERQISVEEWREGVASGEMIRSFRVRHRRGHNRSPSRSEDFTMTTAKPLARRPWSCPRRCSESSTVASKTRQLARAPGLRLGLTGTDGAGTASGADGSGTASGLLARG